jgi:hypothetical protein
MLRLSRRDAFAGLALAALWRAPALAQAAPAAAPLAWTPKALSPDQARTLAAVAQGIMPATDTPGAVEAGVPQFVDRTLADWCDPAQAARLKAELDQIDNDAKVAHAASFAAVTPQQQAAILARRDAAPRPNPWGELKEMVTTAYFTSEAGATKALRFDPVPGAYRGCVPLKEIGRGWATA